MGFINKIKAKAQEALEKGMKKHLTEEQKAEYAQEQEEKLTDQKSFIKIRASYEKSEEKDLEALLDRIGAIDEKALWIGGFLQHRTNLNVKTANLFSGKKNLKFLTFNDNTFYMLQFQDNEIMSYMEFDKPMVSKVSKDDTFTVTLHNKTTMRLVVTENKKLIKDFYNLLK